MSIYPANCSPIGDFLYLEDKQLLVALERFGGIQIYDFKQPEIKMQIEPILSHQIGFCLDSQEQNVFVGCVQRNALAYIVQLKVL